MKRPRKPNGTRNKFEAAIYQNLEQSGHDFLYEPPDGKIHYVSHHTYSPDFVLPNGIIVEAKGKFRATCRSKYLALRKCHPQIDLRFLFQDASRTITKSSRTTYGDWATKNGFLWGEGDQIPLEWLEEAPGTA